MSRNNLFPESQGAAVLPMVSTYDQVFQQIAGKSMDRFERASSSLSNPVGRQIAGGLASFTKPVPFLVSTIGLWMLLYFAKAFKNSEMDPVSVFAAMLMGSLVTTGLLWLARGSQRPNYNNFENYFQTLSGTPSVPNYAYTTTFRNVSEYPQFLSWHMGFIAYIVNRDEGPSFLETLFPEPSILHAIQHILKSIPDGLTFFSDNSTSAAVYETPLLDDFSETSIEEKNHAANLDWKDARVHSEQNVEESRYFEAAVLSQVSKSCIHRNDSASSAVAKGTAVKVLSGLLKTLLVNPFQYELSERIEFDFKKALGYKCFQLINVLRPAFIDNQWSNWRYFYAPDKTVRKAFCQLSTEQQTWMIFTLMSGSDQGKLLALSILQDKKLPTSVLAEFFKAYIVEYGGITLEKARALYGVMHNADPREEVLQRFQVEMVNEFRLQLAWLTQHSNGTIKALFESDPQLAARILRNFTVDLDVFPADDIKGTYAFPQEKPSAEAKQVIQYNNAEFEVVRPKDGGFSECGKEERGEQEARANKEDHADTQENQHAKDRVLIGRADVVRALRLMIKSDDVLFEQGPQHLGMTARDLISYEIYDLLTSPNLSNVIPQALARTPTNGVEDVRKLRKLKDQVNEQFQQCMQYVPNENQTGLQSHEDLIAYFANRNSPLVNTEGDVNDFRQQIHQALSQIAQKFKQRDVRLRDFCKRSDVVDAYLQYGVGVHLPLGVASAAVFSVSKGYHAEMLTMDQEQPVVFIESTHPNRPAQQFFVGKSFSDWGILRTKVPTQTQRAQLQLKPSKVNEPHPLIEVAQTLYSAVGSSKILGRIRSAMEHGDSGVKAYPGSSAQLSSVGARRNRDAIKRGLLQSENLEALWPMLSNHNTRKSAFTLITELFSDSQHNDEFQQKFEALVSAHDGVMCENNFIADFLEWLERSSHAAHIKPDVVRARFSAILLIKTYEQKEIGAIERGDRVEKLLRRFYPNDDIITALVRMREAFSARAHYWEAKRNIFMLIFNCQMLKYESADNETYQLEFLSHDSTTSMLEPILQGFSGDIRISIEARKNVQAWGSLLTKLIVEAYPSHETYLKELIKQLCEIIKSDQTPVTTSQNLSLVLMNALSLCPIRKDEHDITVGVTDVIYSVYNALAIRYAAENRMEINSDELNHLFTLLGAYRETGNFCIEQVYLSNAVYVFRQKENEDANDDANDDDEGRGFMSAAVSNLDVIQNTSTARRIDAGQCLSSFIDALQFSSNDGNGAWHRETVFRALFLVYMDVSLVKYANDLDEGLVDRLMDELEKTCGAAGGRDIANGAKNLFTGVLQSEFLKGSFQEEALHSTIYRMTALLLIKMCKFASSSDSVGLMSVGFLQHDAQVSQMRSLLKIFGIEGTDNNTEVAKIFSPKQPIGKAFAEMGMEKSIPMILKAFKGANQRLEQASSEKRQGETQALLVN